MNLTTSQKIVAERFAVALSRLLDGKTWQKYHVDGYMPLNVEKIGTDLVSVCHYGELNGDMMRDPEMVFKVWTSKEGQLQAVPIYYRNDYAGFEDGVSFLFPDETPIYNGGMVEFAVMWFRNLEEQGFLKEPGSVLGVSYEE